jgi:hypothetical protein
MNIPDPGSEFFFILDPKKGKKALDPGSGKNFTKRKKMEKYQRRLLLVDLLPSREYGNISALGNTEQERIQFNLFA